LQVYLINLDRATERLAHMQQAFDAAGISFTRISAVDGHALSDSDIKRFQSREGYWGWLTPGEIGCFLSHRLCWQTILDGDDNYAAIFEDDVLVGEEAEAILSSSAWIPADADIIKLESAGSRIYVDRMSASEICGRSVKRLRSSHYCTGGYIVSKKGARYLLETSQVFSDAVDDFLFSAQVLARGQLALYQLSPAICIQNNRVAGNPDGSQLPSSIEGREQKLMKKLRFSERLKLIALKERQSATNKLLCCLGKRERIVVDFK